MNTELATTSPSLISSLEDMERVAVNIAGSGMFGITKKEQAITLMLICQAEGLNPISALRRYHLIEGRPSMRSDAMQGEFESKGGAFIFHVRSDAMVAATAFLDKSKIDDKARDRAGNRFELLWNLDNEKDGSERSKLMVQIAKLSREGEDTLVRTAADAWDKGISMAKDGASLKANWSTSPRQMLTARVVTELVPLLNPGLIAGIYSEDETRDIVDQEKRQRETPLSPEAKERIEAKVEAIIEEAHNTPDDIERARLHKAAIALEKEAAAQSPESIAIRKYEEENPEHKGKVAGASQNQDGSWSITLLDNAPKQPTARKQRPSARPAPVNAEDNIPMRWQDIECHVGPNPGKCFGRKLGEIFNEGDITKSPKTEAQVDALVAWFGTTQSLAAATDPKDKSLWIGVQEAAVARKAELSAGGPPAAQNAAPATETPAKTAETPPAPAVAQRWQDFVIEAKHPAYNGKKLGDLTPEELTALRDDYLPKVDWKNATLHQKKIKAMVALATAPSAGHEPADLPPAANEEAAHTARLNGVIKGKGWTPAIFLQVCKMNAWVEETHRTVEDITESEADSLAAEWPEVEKEVQAAHDGPKNDPA